MSCYDAYTEVLELRSRSQYAVQRKHQRYIFSESLVVIRRLSPTDICRLPAICMEISEGGMSAIVTEPLKDGDEVTLSFDVMPETQINVRAIVRNHNEFRYGFEFVGLSEEQRGKIRAACASLNPYEGGWY